LFLLVTVEQFLPGIVEDVPSGNCGKCSFWYLGCKMLEVTVGHVTTSTVTLNHVPTGNCGACSYLLSRLFLVISKLSLKMAFNSPFGAVVSKFP
jgi:hypothetical protein